ncbi:MAG: hypothetical protein NUW06_03505 [Candidatus Acetothermia bacterium]|jgi:hypothetical protein|nr:hypothetical protein [Candidatus Acetothermia bacterium]MDH7504746.1 hypothetical protein [Candidatus Acetothermia bacterium]
MKKYLAIVLLVLLALAVGAVAGMAQEKEILEAQAQARADANADVNYFGCGMGGMFLGPIGWAHAWFTSREMSVHRVLFLQNKSASYKMAYQETYINTKKQMCTIASIAGSLLWVIALFYL